MKRTLMTLALLLATAAAQAHSTLKTSAPADKSRVRAPKSIELQFSDAARLTSLTLQQGTSPARSIGPLPARATREVSVPVSGLTAGDYKVSWRVVSEDGHVMSGSFSFTVDPAAPADATGSKPAAPADHHHH